MPAPQVAPTQPQLFSAPNGFLTIRVPDGSGRYKRIVLGTSKISTARKKFAAYLKKAGVTGIDAATDPINSSWGLLDPNSTFSTGYQIKQLRGTRPGANGADSTNGATPPPETRDAKKRRQAREWYQNNKSAVARRRREEYAAGTTSKQRLAKGHGSVTNGDKLAEARDLVQIIAGAWAAASTALRRLESLLGTD